MKKQIQRKGRLELLHRLLPQHLKNGNFHQRTLYHETLASSKKAPANFFKKICSCQYNSLLVTKNSFRIIQTNKFILKTKKVHWTLISENSLPRVTICNLKQTTGHFEENPVFFICNLKRSTGHFLNVKLLS